MLQSSSGPDEDLKHSVETLAKFSNLKLGIRQLPCLLMHSNFTAKEIKPGKEQGAPWLTDHN